MANPFVKAGQAGQQLAAGIASLPGRSRDPNREYESFQLRSGNEPAYTSFINRPKESKDPERAFRSFQLRSGNEPDAMAVERYEFDRARSEGVYPWEMDIGLFHPEAGPYSFFPRTKKYSDIKRVPNLDPMGDLIKYYDDKEKRIEEIRRKSKYFNKEPSIQAGISNQNLGGYKVWNAGSFGDPSSWDWPFKLWGNKIDELNVENQRLLKEMDDIRMHPLFPGPGPWNEFDPFRREMEYYNDMMDMDDGGDGYDWDSSKGTEVAGTTEDKWGQLVRDGIVNPGDTLNLLEIDQLYNQYYEGGAGDTDQFGVAQSRWKEMWDVMIQNLIDRGIVQDEKEGNTYMFEKTGQSKPMPITANRGGIIGLI